MPGAFLSGHRWVAAVAAALAGAAIAVVLLASQASAAAACTDNFTGSSGGHWNVASNWSGGVPTSSSVACWSTGTVLIDGTDGSVTADSVQGSDLKINGGTLTLTGTNASTLATLELAGGTLTSGGSAGMGLSGAFSFSSGTFNGPAPMSVGAAFTWSGGNLSQTANETVAITVSGSVSINGSGSPSLGGGSISTSQPVSITNTNFFAYPYSGQNPTITTTDTTSGVTFGAGTYGGYPQLTITAPAFNTSASTVVPYTLHLTTGGTSALTGSLQAGVLNTDASTTLGVPTGVTLTVGSGTVSGTIDGAGTYSQNGSTTTINNGATLSTNTVQVPTGTLTIDSTATFGPATGIAISGGTLNLNASASTGTFTMSSGTLNGPGSVSLSGNMTWSGGAISQTANETVAFTQTGGTVSINGSGSPSLGGGSITTSQPVSITNTNFFAYPYSGQNPTISTTNTASGVTFGPGTYGGYPQLTITAPAFNTSGSTIVPYTLHLTTGGTSALSGSLQAGVLNTDASTTLGVPTGVTLSVGSGAVAGTISGAGTYSQNGSTTTINNNATLSTNTVQVPTGTLTISSLATFAPATGISISGGTLNLNTSASTGTFTMSSGTLNGPGSVALSGNMTWSGGAISQTANETVAFTQTGGSVSINGSGSPSLGGGSISTSQPVSITNTNFFAYPYSGQNPTISTTNTASGMTFGPGTYGGYPQLTITAPAFNTSGSTVVPYTLHLTTGGTSGLGGSLQAGVLNTDASTTLTVPTGVVLTVGSGAIGGTIDGAGTYGQNGSTTTINNNATLSTNTVQVPTGTLTISSLATFAPATGISISGGTLNLNTSASTGTFTMSSGTLNGPGSLALSGNMTWSGGAISQTTNETVAFTQTGGSVSINGSGSPSLGGGSISTSQPVSITNTNFYSYPYSGQDPSIATTNTASGVTFGPGTYGGYPQLTITAPSFNTSGSTVVPYTLHLTTGGTSSLAGSLQAGVLNTDASTTLGVPTGVTLSVGSGAIGGTIDGAGTYGQNGSTTTINNNATLSTNTVNVPTGTLTIDAAATFTPSSGISISGGTLNLADSASTGTFTMSNGTLNGPGSLGLTGNMTWSGGAISQTANETVALSQTGGTVSINGSGSPSLGGGSITTSQPVSITNTNFYSYPYSGQNPSITTGNVVTFGPGTYGGYNQLTITAAGFDTSGSTTAPYSLVQSGGTTTVGAGVTFNTGGFTVNGGTLNGTGTLGGTVTNSGGTVAPGNSPGKLSMSGNYVQNSGGTLQIAVNGTGSGQYSVLSVGGNATLGGTLVIVPSAAYQSSVATGDRFHVLTAGSSPSGTFATTTANPAFPQGNSVSADYASTPNTVDAVIGAPTKAYTLTVNRSGSGSGSVTSSPSGIDCGATCSQAFLYGTPVTLTATPDSASNFAGWSGGGCSGTGTCHVTTNSDMTVTASFTPKPAAPANTSAPTITGTPLPGNTLTCHPGSWNGNPTAFGYQWNRDGNGIAGATQPQYQVQIADEGHILTCAVSARNGAGTTTAVTPVGAIVAQPGTLNCPKPTGQISGLALGPLAIGMKQKQAEGILTRFTTISGGFNIFCLFGGWGIRAGYPSAKLLHSVPANQRHALAGKIVIALTGNPFYSLDGISAGMTLAQAQGKAHLGNPFNITNNSWYFVSGGAAEGLIKIGSGVVQEIGIVNKRFAKNRKAQAALLKSWGSLPWGHQPP